MADTQGDDDEFFGDQDDTDDGDFGGRLVIQEDLARQQELKTIGYLESYDEAKETRLQEGFQAGYQETFDLAVRIGALLGEATTRQRLQQKALGLEADEMKNSPSSLVSKKVHSFLKEHDQDDSKSQDVKEGLKNLDQEIQQLLKEWINDDWCALPFD